MKVCFFGSYDKISLDAILKRLLESKGVEVIECQKEVHSFTQLVKAYFYLLKKHPRSNYSFMIVPWRGIMTLPLAKLISKGPIVYFPYISIYDSLVRDRKKISENSLQARFIRFIEKVACNMVNIVVLENNETIDFFCNEYKIDRKKCKKFFWGADEKKFLPCPIKEPEKKFQVLYFGTFIPFHGVNIIVEAARLLNEQKDIKFVICGDGQTKNENEKLAQKYKLTNIQFLGHVEFEMLKNELKRADVCLGAFGSEERRRHVFTNKISEVLISKKPLVTRDVPVMQELLLKNNENCILVEPNNPEKLVESILFLKNNSELTKKIAEEGYFTVKKTVADSWEDFWFNMQKLFFTQKSNSLST